MRKTSVKVMEVTLNLPDNVYRNFQKLAKLSSRRIDEVITEKIQSEYIPDKHLENLDSWSDEDILALANLKLPKAQSDQMSELLDLQQRGTISSAEKRELEVYTELYQIAALHKAQGCLAAVKRGLIKSPADLKWAESPKNCAGKFLKMQKIAVVIA